jgi:hypothetical protein
MGSPCQPCLATLRSSPLPRVAHPARRGERRLAGPPTTRRRGHKVSGPEVTVESVSSHTGVARPSDVRFADMVLRHRVRWLARNVDGHGCGRDLGRSPRSPVDLPFSQCDRRDHRTGGHPNRSVASPM